LRKTESNTSGFGLFRAFAFGSRRPALPAVCLRAALLDPEPPVGGTKFARN
jgi:hypothetical protein